MYIVTRPTHSKSAAIKVPLAQLLPRIKDKALSPTRDCDLSRQQTIPSLDTRQTEDTMNVPSGNSGAKNQLNRSLDMCLCPLADHLKITPPALAQLPSGRKFRKRKNNAYRSKTIRFPNFGTCSSPTFNPLERGTFRPYYFRTVKWHLPGPKLVLPHWPHACPVALRVKELCPLHVLCSARALLAGRPFRNTFTLND